MRFLTLGYVCTLYVPTYELFVLLGYKRIMTMCRKISLLSFFSFSLPVREISSHISHFPSFSQLFFYPLCQIKVSLSHLFTSVAICLNERTISSTPFSSLLLSLSSPFLMQFAFLASMFNVIPGYVANPVYNFFRFLLLPLVPYPSSITPLRLFFFCLVGIDLLYFLPKFITLSIFSG